MAITYQTVTIDGTEYEAYTDLAYADAYLNADINAAVWAALDDNAKGRDIIAATRVLDRQNWLGSKTDEGQELAWPRAGTGISGVEDDVIPDDIINACCELAMAQAMGIDIGNYTTTQSQERRIKAGSVEVENFKATGLAAIGYPLPKGPWLLIRQYIVGTGTAAFARSRGTCGESVTIPGFGFTEGF